MMHGDTAKMHLHPIDPGTRLDFRQGNQLSIRHITGDCAHHHAIAGERTRSLMREAIQCASKCGVSLGA